MKYIFKYFVLFCFSIILLFFILGLLGILYYYIIYGTSESIEYEHKESKAFYFHDDPNMNLEILQPFFDDEVLLTILINESPHNVYNIWIGCNSAKKQPPIYIDYIIIEGKEYIKIEYKKKCEMRNYFIRDNITYPIYSGSVVETINGSQLLNLSKGKEFFDLKVYYIKDKKNKNMNFFIKKNISNLINFPT